MFLIIFSIVLLIANIYCFAKKKYLYLFFPCLLFLPEFYGLELSGTLPVLTVTRMMYIMFYIYSYINKRRPISFKLTVKCEHPRTYYYLGLYFILRIIANLYYITTYLQAVKTIALLIFEQLLLLVAIYLLSPTREEIIKVVKSIVWTSFVFFILGILESLTLNRPFDALYTVSREMMNIHYVRLGLLRSTTTFGMPGYYGNMCILITPIILFLYSLTKQKRYLFICFFDILAIIHSGCRSDLLFFAAIVLIYLFMLRKDKESFKKVLKNSLLILCFLLLWVILLSISNNRFYAYYTGNIKSVLNTVGFNFDLNSGTPGESVGYGDNVDGTGSRLTQLTAINYVAKTNPVFGMGSGAQTRKEIPYYWHNQPEILKTYDSGIIEIVCDEGLLGFLAVISLIIFMFLASKKTIYYRLSLIAYLLSTLSTSNMYKFWFTYIIIFQIYSFYKNPNREESF